MKKLIALTLAVLMMLGMLAACGSSNNTGKNPDTTTTAPAGNDTTGTELKTAVPGKLIMATNAAFPPYEFIEGGKVIADKLGLELQIDDIEFDSIIESVKSGKADIGLAGMTVTDERKLEVDFTVSYATGVQVVIVTEDSKITSVDDLFAEGAKHVVGVQRNTTGDIYTTGDIEDKGLGTIERYSKGADAVQALKTGKVDCVVIDNEPAKAFDAAAMSKDNKELYDAVNKALQDLIADGTIKGIIDKYIPAN